MAVQAPARRLPVDRSPFLPARREYGLGGIAYHWQALIVVVLGSFTVVLNMTIVNVALPRIIAVFQATVDQGQLVVTSYMVAIAIVIPAAGYVTDRFGAKRAYLTTVGLFTIGTALCGFAPSIEGLILFRVLQGLGGGMVMTLGLTILFQATPARQRGSVMGVFGLSVLVAPMVGPIVGGYVVEYLSWRLVFGMAIPIGVLAILAGMAILRESSTGRQASFDMPGFVLAGVSLASALLALYKAPSEGWGSALVVGLWTASGVALAALVVVELCHPSPLLDLRVLANPTYLLATTVSCVFMVGMLGSSLLLPLFLQNVRGLGALDTGLLLAPEAVASAVMMPIAGRLLDKVGPRPLMIPGLVVMALSYWLLAALDPTTPDSVLRGILIVRGLAMGLSMMPAITIAMDTITPAHMARATALGNALRQVAGAFGTALAASILLDRQFYHQAILAQTTTSASISVVQALAIAASDLVGRGYSEGAAAQMALAMVAQQVSKTATIRGYDDCFLAIAAFILVGLVPAALLRRTRRV